MRLRNQNPIRESPDNMRPVILIIFLLALLVTGVLGTETRLLFFWPGCLLLGVAGLLAGLRWKLRISFPPSDWCLSSVLLLAGYLIARAWWSPVWSHAREDLFLVLACLTAYVLTITAASHPRWRLGIFWTLLALAAGNLAVGFVHFSGKWSWHVVPHFARTFGEGRIGGFFNNPNHLAAFFSYVVFLCAGIVCFGRGSASWKLLLGFFVIAFAIGMSLTISRGALAGLLGGGLVFAAAGLWVAWRTQRHLFGRIVIGIGALLLLGGGVLYKVNEEYLRQRIASHSMTSDVRQHVWQAALSQHLASPQPLTGDGARSFKEAFNLHRPAEMPGWSADAAFAHNEYLQMLGDYGWIGLALAGFAALAHLANGMRFLHWFANWIFPMAGLMPSNGVALAAGSIAAITATMIHAVFEFHWHVPATAITGSVLLGILANPGFEGPEHRPMRIPGARLGAKLAMIAASIAMIAGAVTIGRADYHSAQAAIAAKDGDSYAEIKSLAASIEIDGQDADAFHRRGLAWLNVVQPGKSPAANFRAVEKAAADFQKAVELNPRAFLHPLGLADAQDALGRHDEAKAMIERAIRLAPNYEEPRLALAIHHHRLRQWAEAERAYLWAGEAPAATTGGDMRWNDGYFQMLRDAASEAAKTAAKTQPVAGR